MKNLLFLLMALLALTARADERSAQILSRMSSTIGGWASYAVDFRVEGVEGRYVVSGRRYYLQVDRSEVYGEERLRREVNNADREVIVDRIDPADRSILSDPTRVFDFPDAAFTHRFGGTSGGTQIVLLTPREAGSIARIRLEIDPATGLPTAVEYTMEQAREPVRIAIRSIRRENQLPVYDPAKYRGYEVIDFR